MVDPTYQNKGIGKQLVSAALEIAKKNGFEYAMSMVTILNSGSMKNFIRQESGFISDLDIFSFKEIFKTDVTQVNGMQIIMPISEEMKNLFAENENFFKLKENNISETSLNSRVSSKEDLIRNNRILKFKENRFEILELQLAFFETINTLLEKAEQAQQK